MIFVEADSGVAKAGHYEFNANYVPQGMIEI